MVMGMKLILLPGNSKGTKEWIRRVEEVLRPLFEETVILEYEHWKNGRKLIDLNHELKRVEKEAKGEYVILAKSAGVLLAVKGVFEKKLKPVKCVFLGTPIPWGTGNKFEVHKWFENLAIPSLFIQNSHDPAMSYSDLWDYLDEMGVKTKKMVQLEGQSHDYEDLETIKEEVRKFLGK